MSNNLPNIYTPQTYNIGYIPPTQDINSPMPTQDFNSEAYRDLIRNALNSNVQQNEIVDPNTIPYTGAFKSQSVPQESAMTQRGTNIISNAIADIQELGTGINYLWANKDELMKNAPEGIKNYLKGKSLLDVATDVGNLILEPYNIDLKNLEGRSIGDIATGALVGAYTHPVYALTDFLSLGGGKLLGKGLEKVPYLGRGVKAGKVEEVLAENSAKVAKDTLDLEKKVLEADRLATSSGSNLEELIRAAETGADIPKEAKPAFKALREFSDKYDELAKAYSPSTYIGKEDTSIIQAIVREREAVDPAITYAQVQREVTPFLDLIKDGKLSDVTEAAARGDRVASEVVAAKDLFDKGRIFPVTHALADVDTAANKGLIQAAKQAGEFTSGAGRFSERMYGTSTYKDIAKQLKNPDEFLEGLAKKYLNGQVSGAILRGELGSIEGASQNVKNLRYLDRTLLEEGQLQKALESARNEKLFANDIAVDMDVLAPLKEQAGRMTGALDGVTKDIYQAAKSSLLAQGTYIGANVITGGANAIMNSGAGLIGDVISAIKSKGELAKGLGVYRRRVNNLSNRPVIRQIQQINKRFGGGLFQEVDRNVQNAFAEIAAHAELRGQGIPYAERFKAISDADKINLGKTIVDVKRAALINGSKALLPKTVSDWLFMGNPFWRWQDTATQSTYRMLEKHPIMANVALLDVAANIGFDKEMQNRMNLHVDLDKPYVSFKLDPKTGQMKTISAEFVPITTTLKFADFKNQSFAPSIPFFTAVTNAMGGLDKYGRPIKKPEQNGILTQVVGTRRYQYDPAKGWEPIGGKADEIINTAIKEVIGAPNLYNKTVAPLLSPVLSPTGQYYQPYNTSLLGSYDRQNLGNDAIIAGNARRGRTAGDVIKALGGVYEQDYIPNLENVSPQMQRRLTRQYMGSRIRELGEGY